MFLGIFLTRAVPILRQSYFSLTSLQYQLVAWHSCIANFIISVSESGRIFLRCKPRCPVLREHHGHDESFILCAFIFSPSVRQGPWKCHLHPLEISAMIWGMLYIRKKKIRDTLILCSQVFHLWNSKGIIWTNLVIVAGNYQWTLTMGQPCSNCCMYMELFNHHNNSVK